MGQPQLAFSVDACQHSVVFRILAAVSGGVRSYLATPQFVLHRFGVNSGLTVGRLRNDIGSTLGRVWIDFEWTFLRCCVEFQSTSS